VTRDVFFERLRDVISLADPEMERADPITVEDIVDLQDRLDRVCEEARERLEAAE
jgi:hypothetical protein